MKKIFVAAAALSLLVSHAQDRMIDTVPGIEIEDEQPNEPNPINDLIEKIVGFVKNEIERPKSKNKLLYLAYTDALDEQVYRQVPTQPLQLNVAALEQPAHHQNDQSVTQSGAQFL
jgi:hypothetical protein